MAWYRTGTVTVTNGSATITGSGTAFIANASIGEGFLGPDGRTYEVTNIVSDTSLTISPNYLGSTAGGQAYAIAPLRGRIADLIAETSSLLSSFATVRDGIGSGLFPDGSAATPGFRFTNDQDTGIYRYGTNVLGLSTAGAVRVVVNASGNMGIGIEEPGTYRLNVNRGSQGNIGQFTDGVESTFVIRTESGILQVGQANNLPLALLTNGIERMRVTASGDVGIATTAVTPTFGRTVQIGDGSSASTLSLVGTAGAGFLAVSGTDFFLTSRAGTNLILATGDVTRVRINTSGHVLAGEDNAQTLGGASARWSVVYAGTGTINTSDERDKHWRGELNAAELRAAKRIIAELGIYQWNDAVAEKGEDARLHFGVRAQRAFQILEDEGLDWSRYAWACYDQWDEQTEPVRGEDGEPTGETRVTLEAGDRYGVRPDQLAFWLIAAQAAIQADLEARLAALEAA